MAEMKIIASSLRSCIILTHYMVACMDKNNTRQDGEAEDMTFVYIHTLAIVSLLVKNIVFFLGTEQQFTKC
jgi:hypothetical protein